MRQEKQITNSVICSWLDLPGTCVVRDPVFLSVYQCGKRGQIESAGINRHRINGVVESMGSDSIDPGIRIVAQTASASFLSRLHTTASRHPQRLDAPADWGKFRITLSGKGFVRLSRFSPALPATSAPPCFPTAYPEATSIPSSQPVLSPDHLILYQRLRSLKSSASHCTSRRKEVIESAFICTDKTYVKLMINIKMFSRV